MGEFVWLNNRLMPVEEARISPLDRGFLYGDGLFETMRSYNGSVHLLRRHLERLGRGGERIGLKIPGTAELRDAINAVVRANARPDVPDLRVRLTVSRGPDTDSPSILFIRCSPLLQKNNNTTIVAETGKEDLPEGEELVVLPLRRNVPEIVPRLKSLNYLPEILAQDELRRQGLREGILLTGEGYVAEGSVSNLFCVVGGELLTPPLSLGILPGITRGRILELAQEEGLPHAERPFTLDEFLNAEECFYTNSVREVVPVCSVDGTMIGAGTPGPVTARLCARYRVELPDEEL